MPRLITVAVALATDLADQSYLEPRSCRLFSRLAGTICLTKLEQMSLETQMVQYRS